MPDKRQAGLATAEDAGADERLLQVHSVRSDRAGTSQGRANPEPPHTGQPPERLQAGFLQQQTRAFTNAAGNDT